MRRLSENPNAVACDRCRCVRHTARPGERTSSGAYAFEDCCCWRCNRSVDHPPLNATCDTTGLHGPPPAEYLDSLAQKNAEKSRALGGPYGGRNYPVQGGWVPRCEPMSMREYAQKVAREFKEWAANDANDTAELKAARKLLVEYQHAGPEPLADTVRVVLDSKAHTEAALKGAKAKVEVKTALLDNVLRERNQLKESLDICAEQRDLAESVAKAAVGDRWKLRLQLDSARSRSDRRSEELVARLLDEADEKERHAKTETAKAVMASEQLWEPSKSESVRRHRDMSLAWRTMAAGFRRCASLTWTEVLKENTNLPDAAWREARRGGHA